MQGNLEGESSNLSEVTWGFFTGAPSYVVVNTVPVEVISNDKCLTRHMFYIS